MSSDDAAGNILSLSVSKTSVEDLYTQYEQLAMGHSFSYESSVDGSYTLRIFVTRVPGGYIHTIGNACVFVPGSK